MLNVPQAMALLGGGDLVEESQAIEGMHLKGRFVSAILPQ